MANPTTNRPSPPVFDASLGFGPTAKAIVDCAGTVGSPVESKSRVVGRPWVGGGGSWFPRGYGKAPRFKAAGFTHTPDGGSPSLRFGYGSPGLVFPGCGVVSGDAATRTIAAVFRCDFLPLPGVAANYVVPVVQAGSRDNNGAVFGLAVQVNATTITLGTHRGNASFEVTSPAVTLTPGRWYAVAVSFNGTARRYQAYDYTAQALHATLASPQDITAGGSVAPPASGSDLAIAGTNYTSSTYQFTGEVAAVLLDLQYWDSTNFAAFWADPWATARGTYSASGTFTAPATGNFLHGEGGCTLTFARATGTGTAGTGSPTYHLQRYTDPVASVSSGARIATVTPEATGAVSHLDSTAVAGTTYWYRLECVDGSDTVYHPASNAVPIPARRLRNAAAGVCFIGDSRTQGELVATAAGMVAQLSDRPVPYFNRGKTGNYAAQWTSGVNSRFTLAVTGGTPTSGTFTLGLQMAGGSGMTFRNIPWNCSAALLKTILEDDSGTYTNAVPGGSTTAGVGGAGNVTCTGGPLPGTPITADFDGPTSQKKNFGGTPSAGNSLMNNSAVPSLAVVWRGTPEDATYFTPMLAEVQAQATAEGCPWWVHLAVGTNDMNGAGSLVAPVDYGRYVAAACASLVAAGIKVALSSPPMLRPGTSVSTGFTQAGLSAGQAYRDQLAALDDGANVFYLGSRTWDQTVREQLGTVDGLHGLGAAEGRTEQEGWGVGLALAMAEAEGDSTSTAGLMLLLGVG